MAKNSGVSCLFLLVVMPNQGACYWHGARAGIPGVAGRLVVPAKPNIFGRGKLFFARKRKKRCWVFFSPFGGVLMLLGGVFVLFLGVFVLFGFFLFFARRQREMFGGS